MRIRPAMWVVVVSTWAAVAAADPCAKPSDGDASPAAAVAIGDCYARQGDNAQAAHWYRDAAQRALAAPVDAPPAAPDHREAWRASMWISLAVTAVGITTYAVGRAEMNDATSQLCAGGAYPSNPSCGPITLTASQVATLNEQGERGQTYSRVGLAAGLVGAGAALVSAYQGYVGHHESRVVIAPVLAPGSAGAQLGVRW